MINGKLPIYFIYPAVAAISLAWVISSILGNIYMSPKAIPVAVKKVVEKPADIGMLANNVIEKNIFNLEITPPAVAESTTNSNGVDEPINDTPPPPPFNASLVGIIMARSGEQSLAIIKVEENTYVLKEGNEKDGIKLRSVAEFSVIISKDNKNYTLELTRDESILTKMDKPSEPKPPKEVEKPQEITTGANLNITINREEVEEELKDLNKILQSALVSPYYEAGNFLGYRLARMRDDSPLKNLGLATGDVITRINGNELKSPELLFNMLSQLDDISAIAIDMVRNNEKKTLFVEIQ